MLRAGGVGKTTTAAAIALRAAEYGRTVVVLTIDPAKRLAQALGMGVGQRAAAGSDRQRATGQLHAMMLDMRRTFDEMVIEHSGPERAQAILDNQFYQTVATSLAGTQEYMAMEKLGQLLGQDRWDLVVVDTRRRATRWTSSTPPNGSAASWTAGCGGCCWRPAAASASWSPASSAGHEGDVDDPGFADALRCLGVRAVAGLHLRWLPGEGRPHL